MRYRRALFLVDRTADAAPALAVLHRVAPQLEHVLLVTQEPSRWREWLAMTPWGAGEEASLEALRMAAAGVARSVDVLEVPELGGAALTALCVAEDIDLLVLGSGSLRSAVSVSSLRASLPVAVLWAEGRAASGPIEHVACVTLDARSRVAIEVFLRDHADASMQVALLAPAASPELRAVARQLSSTGIAAEVSTPAGASSLRPWLEAWARERPLDLVVFPRAVATLLMGALSSAPVLLVPAASIPRPVARGAIDVADVVDDGGALSVYVEQVGVAGQLSPMPDQTLAFVVGGRVAATVEATSGEAVLPAEQGVHAIGVYRTANVEDTDPLAAVEQWIGVVRPSTRPLLLFDAEVPQASLRVLAGLTGADVPAALAVRMRPVRSCGALRERLRAHALAPTVLDARGVLDEGEALDVSELHDAVRLARVASKLRRVGFPVVAIVHRGTSAPAVQGYAAIEASSLEREGSVSVPRVVAQPPASSLLEGNDVELETDNATARRWLLEAIEQSTSSLHLQVYMAADDEVGRSVEAALVRAAARGVAVRVLVDSLFGLHGSFGAQNPLLERLSSAPGVELRVVRPITKLPSLAELKQRDHRKLVVADSRLALVGGRNLAREYYVGFDEVALSPTSPWREVPWLDAGARVRGPAVATLEGSFRDAWCEAGGEDFDIAVPPPAGTTPVRVVVHHGLRDACTLETYRALIEAAREHVYVVNGFPLVLELQHALLRALARGVRVRTLIGHVMPTHGSNPFAGLGTSARAAATALVHSRLDPIVAAGGEVYLLGWQGAPAWSPELGVVHPHVHAKAMSVDGQRCTVGSANFDVTASYWESELLLVIEDPALAGAFEANLDEMMVGSTLVDREDPTWQQLARRRAWMRHWPGVLSV